jgi:hypothetical protein
MITSLPPGFQQLRGRLEQRLQVIQFVGLRRFGVPGKFWSRMNPSPLSLIHWPGRGRYHLRKLSGGRIGRARTMALAILRDLLSSPNS